MGKKKNRKKINKLRQYWTDKFWLIFIAIIPFLLSRACEEEKSAIQINHLNIIRKLDSFTGTGGLDVKGKLKLTVNPIDTILVKGCR